MQFIEHNAIDIAVDRAAKQARMEEVEKQMAPLLVQREAISELISPLHNEYYELKHGLGNSAYVSQIDSEWPFQLKIHVTRAGLNKFNKINKSGRQKLERYIITSEMLTWMKRQKIEWLERFPGMPQYDPEYDTYYGYLCFKRKEDAMLFKLRWGTHVIVSAKGQ